VTNNLSLPLSSDLYLTGPTLGNAPCPRCILGGGGCSGSTLCCESGPNSGQPCTPGTSLSGVSYPTSHDCPPPAPFIGTLPIPFNLTTGAQTKTAANFLAGHKVFCGFCGQGSGSTPFAFKGVCVGGSAAGSLCNQSDVALNTCVAGGGTCQPTACTSDSQCSTFTTGCGSAGTSACNRCRQRTDGAFQQGVAHTVSEAGSPANACITTGSHSSTLVSVFCIPPSFNTTVDGNGDLPGPGAVSLPGTAQMLP
jgi:hypothetical protein